MLDLADLGELYKLDRPDLKNDPWLPQPRPPWNSIESAAEQFTAIRAGDLLVHHPYDSFASSFESYVDRAASDPAVIAVKSTVYRTSDDTPLVPALVDASERGKQTVCLVEIKARGDERRNIEWSRSLEEAGVHIVYGFPGLKIHAKTTLIVRREAGGPTPLRPSGHRQLQRRHRAQLRGLRPVHRRRGHRRRRRGPLQPPDRLRAARPVPQAARGAVHAPRAADRGDPAWSPELPRPARRHGSGSR